MSTMTYKGTRPASNTAMKMPASSGMSPASRTEYVFTGDNKKDKAAKVTTARDLWVPALNNAGNYGRWAFVEVTHPWDARRIIRQSFA